MGDSGGDVGGTADRRVGGSHVGWQGVKFSLRPKIGSLSAKKRRRRGGTTTVLDEVVAHL